MTLEEKTCQTATLYGYNRVLKDELPTPDWKNQISFLGRTGSRTSDEHLNGWSSGSKSVYATDIEKHCWAMNEVQKFFIAMLAWEFPLTLPMKGCEVSPIL